MTSYYTVITVRQSTSRDQVSTKLSVASCHSATTVNNFKLFITKLTKILLSIIACKYDLFSNILNFTTYLIYKYKIFL